ncbi:hypothetical protein NMD51_20615 [Escherichia coli]|uniref:hypothetical protein n=1 Tax=Escherichia coli TaxID=562 RepID=UPI002FBEFA66
MSDSTISSLKEKLNTPTWHLVLLAAATYGIYPLMWLYKNQDTIMDEVGQRFSSGTFIVWMAVCSGVSVMLNLLFPVQVDQYGYAYDSSAQMMAGLALLISLAWIVLTIVWAFKARAALQQYALTQFRFELKMNPAWTILFHVFYINYCINAMPEALAKHQIIHGKPGVAATTSDTEK